jgi:hypothetical protein
MMESGDAMREGRPGSDRSQARGQSGISKCETVKPVSPALGFAPLPATGGLVVGRTTKAEALAMLGAPLSVRRQFDGDLLLWSRREVHGTRLRLVPFLPLYEDSEGHAEDDVLALLFGHDGILAGFGVQRDIGP